MGKPVIVIIAVLMTAGCQTDVDHRLGEVDARLAELEETAKSLKAVYERQVQTSQQLQQEQQRVEQLTEGLKQNTFGDGVWEIGVDIQPGKYKRTSATARCYWETQDDNGGTIQNDIVNGPATIRIPKGAFAIKSQRCGEWTRTGS
ncbi:MAG: hypothetical protein AAGF92_14980 [Myxococcota bacterium]